jgi:hypothetical protein
MTTISTAIRFARLGLAALLLGVGVPNASSQSTPTGEITSTPIVAPLSQAKDPGESQARTAPAQAAPAQYSVPTVGAIGFGWG